MNTITIDFTRATGRVKPMHAVNNVPTVPLDFYGLYGKLQEARVPYGRLHDTGGAFGGTHYVDVANVFPDFSADESDLASYDFAFTDALLSEMKRFGIEPFYRLGCTIENQRHIRAYHIDPPSDFAKWARICAHIVAHYNEGWAEGFHHGITYWEIWNEPDNEPDALKNPMWTGTPEKYFELYDVTARYLKSLYPSIKVGGYASCGFYALSSADFSETAHSSSRVGYFVDFFLDFLRHISARETPLDFFSWHSYAGVTDNVRYADYVREKLDEAGYRKAEIVFDEWNPGIANRGEPRDASDIAAMMVAMQASPVDLCMYYDAQISSRYCGLFDPVHQGVFKAYYAFRAFGELYACGTAVESACDLPGVYVCAAKGEGRRLALLVNTNGEAVPCSLCEKPMPVMVTATDETHTWETLRADASLLTLPPYAVWLVEL